MNLPVYVIVPRVTVSHEFIFNVLKVATERNRLIPINYVPKHFVYGGNFDGVISKNKNIRVKDQLINNILEIEKVDLDDFSPLAIVTPKGDLHAVRQVAAFLPTEFSDEEMMTIWKNKILDIFKDYPGHMVVCCDVGG